MNKKISFIGAGNMGGAIIKAVCRKAAPEDVLITDLDMAKCADLAQETRCRITDSVFTAVKEGTYIFLCVKPQVLEDLISEINPLLENFINKGEEKIIVSIAAGVTLEKLKGWLGQKLKDMPLIRMMPNTPVAIGKGMSAITAGSDVSEKIIAELQDILAETGKVEKIPESLIDAFGTVNGCGPAFTYMYIEALADGAVLTGLSRTQALTYAAQMVLGSASMVLETDQHPEALKDAVCSPKGSTIVGVAALERNGFRSAVIEAVTDAYNKTVDLLD